MVDDHISHADMSASDVANTWTLIASEGDMKVYKREVEDTGAVVQHPLKAVHTVKVIQLVCCGELGSVLWTECQFLNLYST